MAAGHLQPRRRLLPSDVLGPVRPTGQPRLCRRRDRAPRWHRSEFKHQDRRRAADQAGLSRLQGSRVRLISRVSTTGADDEIERWPDLPDDDQPRDDTTLRHEQLKVRLAEMEQTVSILRRMSAGARHTDLCPTSEHNEAWCWDSWGCIDTDPGNVAVVGHSLGGSAAILSGADSQRFPWRRMVVMDPAIQRASPCPALSVLDELMRKARPGAMDGDGPVPDAGHQFGRIHPLGRPQATGSTVPDRARLHHLQNMSVPFSAPVLLSPQ